MELFKEFHSSQKTGSLSQTVQKALLKALKREKAESRQVEQIVEDQRREIDALQKKDDGAHQDAHPLKGL
ncbi:hypothetical protein EJB05_46783, partial [Eragrostis curvula]